MTPIAKETADALRQGLEADARGRRNGRQRSWPEPMGRAAFHGLAGEFVELAGPTTEADPHGLLVQFLACAGNVIGRGPGIVADGTFHPPTIWAVLLGESSKARKGTSWARVRQLYELVDEEWVRMRVCSGLSSGEGLVWQVRDQRVVRRKAKKAEEDDADEDGMVEEVADEGVVDKRLLVVEPEFAQPFKAMQRDGNTLAIALRCAWDNVPIGGLTKKDPTRADHHLISVIGHITAGEARRVISDVDIRSGLINRMLLCCVKRARELPYGGFVDEAPLNSLADDVRHAVRVAATLKGRLEHSDDTKRLWKDRYHDLSAPRPGALGDVVARSEAQVLRLSSIYALLDETAVVGTSHLEAAFAVWRYCEDSARYLFGERTGDRLADKFLAALRRRPGGLTRSELRDDIAGSDRPAERIEEALEVLELHELAHCTTEDDTGGRPAERWFATTELRAER
jgi:Protein of unknown function (DUF3987)